VHDVTFALKYASPQLPGSKKTLRGCGGAVLVTLGWSDQPCTKPRPFEDPAS
jgi:hypothetical protein